MINEIRQRVRSGVKRLIPKRVLHSKSRRFVFIYHDISDPDSDHFWDAYSTRVADFERQILFLKSHFSLVSLDDLATKKGADERMAAITFDDGFRSVLTEAAPILERLHVPYTVFVNRKAVETDSLANGKDGALVTGTSSKRVFLSKEELLQMHSEGVLIGSHGSSHANLAAVTPNELEYEIQGNKTFIEELLKAPVEHFALPFGKKRHFNRDVLELAHRAGHRYVYTSNPVPYESSAENASGLISRIGLTSEDNEELLFLINRTFFRRVDL